METFLIAHTDRAGHGAAQAQIEAETESQAIEKFEAGHPERVVTTVGILGVEG